MILPGTLLIKKVCYHSPKKQKALVPKRTKAFRNRFNHLFEVRGAFAGYQFPVTEENPSALTLLKSISNICIVS